MSDTTPTAPTETDPNAVDNTAAAGDNFADGSQLARCTLIDASLVSSRMTLLCTDCTWRDRFAFEASAQTNALEQGYDVQ